MSTGAIVPFTCRTWACATCGPRRARRLGVALDRGGYDRWLTITNAPTDVRQGVARLRHLLAKSSPVEWAWSVERGDVSGMIHVHLVVRGWVDHRRTNGEPSPLDRACARAGFGTNSWIEQANGGAATYAAKCASYASKGSLGYGDWLTLNGGKRPWHWSRGYTGGVSMRAFIARVLPSSDPGPWVPYSGQAVRAFEIE